MFPNRLAIARCFAFFFLAISTGAAAEDHATLPVTLYPGKAGDLVRAWWKQGTAAGSVGRMNSPYVYTAHDSSRSELAFMDAAALTLAAFHPDVKSKLIKKGLLLPTLQTILRHSYKPAPEPSDYFTGKAHPTVFESAKI